MTETTLERARAGDSEAFQELVEPHRRELLVHCYRLLGSLQDAEDVLQDTLVAAWRALEQFDGRSLRAWLYRIATNRCRNYLRDESRRPQAKLLAGTGSTTDGIVSSEEPWWLEPYPDAMLGDTALGPEARYDRRESIALSFVAGLQHLPAQQRAALVLRDVLGFTASEAAAILDTTPTAVNSALVRARASVRPERDLAHVPLPRSAHDAEVVDRFVGALERGDVAQVVAVLTRDAKLIMPPEPAECRGSRAIAEFLRRMGFWGRELKLVPTRANNQAAFGYSRRDPASGARASGIVVLSLANNRVSTITRFGDPALLARFGLSELLQQGAP
jgi:RNA polymerase sigma-70 factor (TIGR02960 family)